MGIVAFGTPEDSRGVDAASGDVLWTVPAAGNIWQGSGTVADGTVYVTDGRTKWVAEGTGSVLGPPAASDGIVYFNEPNGPLYALTAE